MIRRESRIRSIGYGAMVAEMMVRFDAMIAACVWNRESISQSTQKERPFFPKLLQKCRQPAFQ